MSKHLFVRFWDSLIATFRRLKPWVRYAYFLRFSVALWLFPGVLCALNQAHFTDSLTSGILTPERPQQYICVWFFILSSGFVALISARVVLLNGVDRFGDGKPAQGAPPLDGRPRLLRLLLVNDDAKNEGWAVLASQFPNLYVWWYLDYNAAGSLVPRSYVHIGLLVGGALALFLWGVANAWYYITYEAISDVCEGARVEFGKNAARTLLFPRSWFNWVQKGSLVAVQAPESAEWIAKEWTEEKKTEAKRKQTTRYSRNSLEGASTGLNESFLGGFLKWSADLVSSTGTPGYTYHPEGKARFFEGHSFSILSIFLFLMIYVLVWPLAAPVPAFGASLFVLAVLSVFVVYLTTRFWKKPTQSKTTLEVIDAAQDDAVADVPAVLSKFRLRTWQIVLTIAVWLFVLIVAGMFVFSSAERFPVFAVILILVTFLCWFFCGLAFFFDRYRVPVITSVLLAMIVPRLFHGDLGHEEHYLSAVSLSPDNPIATAPVETPAQILNSQLADSDGKPLIIVTSTGGGLHASAWTAAILAKLENTFNADGQGSFHRHLLLASTVSGGSVGLTYYLRELHSDQPDFDRMQIDAQCSSLEAAGWGLVYYDLQKALIPILPVAFKPSSGLNDLKGDWRGPLGMDRTWSLRKAFARNLQNDYCQTTWKRDHGENPPLWRPEPLLVTNEKDLHNSVEPIEDQLTLRHLLPDSKDNKHVFPAFAINTTAFETGDRFLLANYKLPELTLDYPCNYRAKSFLTSFSSDSKLKPLPLKQGEDPATSITQVSDLPIVTAAQLSATFPFVSSAARAPRVFDEADSSVHFVDGGYYDNDGTASAIEFLRYALGIPVQLPPSPPNAKADDIVGPCYNERKSERDREIGVKEPGLIHIEAKASSTHPLRILLIEIRNSGDEGGTGPEGYGVHSNASAPANLLTQVTAPLVGFWQAGHQSITGRNRVLIAQLEHALAGRLQIHRIVFADNNAQNETGTDPLSWSLTPKQREEVRDTASGVCDRRFLNPDLPNAPKCDKSIPDKYDEAWKWFTDTKAWQGGSGGPE